MLSTRRASALRRERTAALRIPYTAHVAERVVKTALGDYLPPGYGGNPPEDTRLTATAYLFDRARLSIRPSLASKPQVSGEFSWVARSSRHVKAPMYSPQ